VTVLECYINLLTYGCRPD